MLIVDGSTQLLAEARVGNDGKFIARATRLSDGARLELFDQYRGREFRFELRVGELPRIEMSPVRSWRAKAYTRVACWAMDTKIDPGSVESIVSFARLWAVLSLNTVVRRQHGRARNKDIEVQRRAQVWSWVEPILDVVRAAENAAIERCDAAALALASKFSPELRFLVYCRLVADRSGRLAQLVESCPGVFIFADTFFAQTHSPVDVEAGERLLNDIIAGCTLDAALDTAIERRIAYVRRVYEEARSNRQEEEEEDQHPEVAKWWWWPRVLNSEHEAERYSKQLRLLIRRAGPHVRGGALVDPPLVVIANDIPRSTHENATWFSVVRISDEMTASYLHDNASLSDLQLMFRFLSRNASYFSVDTIDSVNRLYEYANETAQWPTRTSNPERVIARCNAWHERKHVRELEVARRISKTPMSELTFPSPRIEPIHCDIPEIDIQPITTPRDLIREGNEMHHCVAMLMNDALMGNVFLFRGIVNRERVTIELVHRRGKWSLGDARRACNKRPSEPTIALIDQWSAAAIRQLHANKPHEISRTASACGLPFI